MNIRLVSQSDVRALMSGRTREGLSWVREAFIERSNDRVLLPDKISQIFDEEFQNRINCMPATLLDQGICGVKWISVFPSNRLRGLHNVSGQVMLSETKTGRMIALIDGTWLTAFRTAAAGAIASKYLAKPDCRVIGFIGAGAEAQMHFRLIREIHPEIVKCKIASRTEASERKMIENLSGDFPDVEFISCATDVEESPKGADIIVTATNTQAPLLKADAISDGALYIHVAGYEDEYDVVRKADKIVCDEWDSVKHRSQTLSRMYYGDLLRDEDIYADLPDIIIGKKPGRESDGEFIYFNSVGMAYMDVYFAHKIYLEAVRLGIGEEYEIGE